MSDHIDLGYFGNIWVRQNILPHSGDVFPGHKHRFDHVSLLIRGSVEVQVKGSPRKIFKAPTFIVIRKEYEHRFTALEDDTVFYCIFALRDIDGEVYEPVFGKQHDPMSADALPTSTPEQIKKLVDATHEFTEPGK